MAPIHDENHHAKQNGPLFFFFSDGYGLRLPVIQKPFQPQSATSVVARVIDGLLLTLVVSYNRPCYGIRSACVFVFNRVPQNKERYTSP